MEKNETKESFLGIAIKIFGKLTNVVSVIISFSAFAYIIGWFQAKAYFSVFNASWLLSQMDSLELLKFSWLPLLALVYLFWLGIDDLAATQDQKPNKRQERAFWIVNYGRWIVAVLMILTILTDIYGYTKISEIITILTICAFLLLASSAFEGIIIYIREKTFKWDRVDATLIFIIIAVGFYFLPSKIGSIQGRMDLDFERSSLPVVKIKEDANKNYRLLFNKDDKYFIFSMSKNDSVNPKISIINSAMVEYITKKNE